MTNANLKIVDFPPTEGRACDVETLLRQIGAPTIMAVCGGRLTPHYNKQRERIGLNLMCGRSRWVVVIYEYSDLYSVYRFRRIDRGDNRGKFALEYEAHEVDATAIGSTVYEASIWR